MTAEFIEKLTGIVCGDVAADNCSYIKFDEPMAKHTTFCVGGPADVFVLPKNSEVLAQAIDCCKAYDIPWMVIGRGSNLLVGDGGIRGVVFCICHTMEDVVMESCADGGVCVTAGAGIMLSKLAKSVENVSLTGFEFASGIPGTFGGAITMNAGAYGGEINQCLVSAKVLNAAGQILEMTTEQLQMGYRTSIIQKEDLIVLEGTLKLYPGDPEAIAALTADLNGRRKDKQPLEFPSAGSTFKRPEGHFAGKLIQDCGLKGYTVGGAQVSEKHSGFVINIGGATANDIKNLMTHVQSVVYENYQVMLEPEVRIIGDWI